MTRSAAGLLRKLRGRSFAELVERGGQLYAAAFERAGWRQNGELSAAAVEAKLRSTADIPEEAWPLTPRFFASFDDLGGTLDELAKMAPESLETLIHRANEAKAGRFDLLGFAALSFGQPIDWWLDPVSGVRAPERHWSRVAYLDARVVGDHKLVWELNRHQHLVALGIAALVRPDGDDASVVDSQLNEWMDANPPKRGLNWSSSLEVALRSISWIWVMALLRDRLPRATRRRLAGFLWYAGRHIERYLSTYFSPNTHLTGEALGLFYIGTMLPGFADSPRWRDRGASIMLEWLPRHVRRDGTYVEQSTWYHRYTLDFYTHFMLLAGRHGLDVRDRVLPVLEGMTELLAAISRPDGTMPILGDDDGGKLIELDERTAADVRTPFAIGAAICRRGDFAQLAGAASGEALWLLGPVACRELAKVARANPSFTSRAFGDGGVFVIRDGWTREASVATIDCGPHAFQNGGHAHADALAIDLVLRGLQIFVDPGTFTYTGDATLRDQFRATASHNAVTVDGVSSSELAGTFQWATMAREVLLAWSENDKRVLVQGSHDGFTRLNPPATYERTVMLLRPSLWVVRDVVESTGEHDIGVHFQCAPGLRVTGAEDTRVTIMRGETAVARMVMHSGGGRLQMSEGWVSARYGARTPAPHICVSVRGRGRQTITTFITAGSAGPLEVRADPSGATESFDVQAGEEHFVVTFPPTGAVVTDRRASGVVAQPAGNGAALQPSAASRMGDR